MNRREALIERVSAAFEQAYGHPPAHIVGAPGRVNLIGEHCDYNDGLVLPCAIDRETLIAIGDSDDGHIRSFAADFDGESDAFATGAPIERTERDWQNHIRGVAHFLQQQGVGLRASKLAIAGDVPIGAGLSSSASLGVATGLALAQLSRTKIDPVDLARAAQMAEIEYVGCACGIMDQMASACSKAGSALLIDCRTLETRPVPIADDLAIVIIDSGIRRTLTNSRFNERRAECEAAARHYGVPALRDLDIDTLNHNRGDIDETLFRRARHVVTEIARVEAAVPALAAGDLPALSALMHQSHRSLSKDFEVSLPAIDSLVSIIADVIGNRGGVRMTGAGFGGCLVAITAADMADAVIDCVENGYNRSADIAASAGIFRPSAGAHLIC